MVSVDEQEHVRDVTVANVYGLHARPAAEFVKLAAKFESEILVSKDGLEVNGKSIMGVMMLAAEKGSTIKIRARGADAREAVEALVRLVADGFGEE
jgi:phosphocarrier protein HPr